MSGLFQERKLPVLATAANAIGGTIAKFGNLVSIAWLPLLILITLNIAVTFLPVALVAVASPANAPLVLYAAAVCVQILTTILLTMLAIIWYRRDLLGESPEGLGALRFGKREAVYLGYSVVIVGIGIAGAAVWVGTNWLSGTLFGTRNAFSVVGKYALVTGGLVGVGFIYFRAIFVLPAVATSEPRPFRLAWKVSQGNCWRLFGSSILTVVISLLVVAIVGVLFAAPKLASGNFLVSILLVSSGAYGIWLQLLFQAIFSILPICFMMLGVLYTSSAFSYLTNRASEELVDTFSEQEAPPEGAL